MNELDVLAAWEEIGRGDTGAGGLVPLTGGKTAPILRARDRRAASPPIVAIGYVISVKMEGSPPRLETRWRAYARVADGATQKLEATLLDQLEAVTRQPNFAGVTTPLDVSCKPGSRRNATELFGPDWEGGRMLVQDYTLRLTL